MSAGDRAFLPSCLCTEARLTSPVFWRWAEHLGEPRLQRKIWERCYIVAALEERGMLREGRRGLGFAVGKEPLPALFAGLGCEIVATDLPMQGAKARGWMATSQHADALEDLNDPRFCSAAEFERRVRFEPVDMNRIPTHLTEFDFAWSACSFEHLGSIALGEQFVYNSLACLKPGGIAVHTTEYNVSSNTATVDYRNTVLYRRCDIERIAERLAAAGHRVATLDLDPGNLPSDQIVDAPPYGGDPHLKLLIKQYVCTSVGLIVEKVTDVIPEAPRYATPRRLRDVLRPWAARLKETYRRRRAHAAS